MRHGGARYKGVAGGVLHWEDQKKKVEGERRLKVKQEGRRRFRLL